MELSRRSFLGATAAASAVKLIVPTVESKPPAPPTSPLVTPAEASDVVVLGPELETEFGLFVRQLSDDVFRRLMADFPPVRLSTARQLGDGESIGETDGGDAIYRTLGEQWNTGVQIPSRFMLGLSQPYFDLEKFRRHTSHWTRGLELALPGDVPTREAFAHAQVVGLPELPKGLVWCAHYLDPKSGAAMRVVADWYSLRHDTVTVRYDVLVG